MRSTLEKTVHFQPIPQCRTSPNIPWTDFLGCQELDAREFITQRNLTFGPDVVGKDYLVSLLEDVMPDKADDLAIQPKLFLHLAQSTLLRRFACFKKTCHNAKPLFRPALTLGQDDLAFVFHDGATTGTGLSQKTKSQAGHVLRVCPPISVSASSQAH